MAFLYAAPDDRAGPLPPGREPAVRRGRRAALVAPAERSRRAHALSRTISLWLPFVVDHYVTVTGDRGVLDERVPFLGMRPLAPASRRRTTCRSVRPSGDALRALPARARRRLAPGAHGLPLIGAGDWNDGMNRVGAEGRGESVWLAWFLATTLRAFAEILPTRGEGTVATELRDDAAGLPRRGGGARLGRCLVPAGL